MMKNSLVILALFAITLFSCSKEPVSIAQQKNAVDHLKLYFAETIKINQAALIYDLTAIKDSLDFQAPSDKYYEWITLPNNGCDSIIGNDKRGVVQFIFHCPGTYSITAKIYDSLTHNLIGNTDTLEVTVIDEILYPSQPMQQDDMLNIKAGIIKTWSQPHSPSNSPPDEIYVSLILLTNKMYDYYTPYIQFDYTSSINASNYSYTFANSIKLTSYPYAFGYGVKSKVDGEIDIKGLKMGIPVNLSITWLGLRYSGSVTLVNEDKVTSNWVNAGAVILKI